ncbi:HNH endonuclease [Embleya sp. NPDC059259]
MAIGRRLRYEVLRRDDHACRYCGAKAPAVKLVVDHVVPQALGGTDMASNLVTACEECNSGKASVTPGADVVEDVAKDAVRWAAAMKEAVAAAREDYSTRLAYREGFAALWEEWTYGADNENFPLPGGWESSIDAFRAAGLEAFAFEDAIRLAMSNTKVSGDNKFRYFCGVAWARVRRLQDHARAILSTGDGSTGNATPHVESAAQHSCRDCFSLTATAIWIAGRRKQPMGVPDDEEMDRIVEATSHGTKIGAILEDQSQWHRLHEVMGAVHDAASRDRVDPNELLPEVPIVEDVAQAAGLAEEFSGWLGGAAEQPQDTSRPIGTGWEYQGTQGRAEKYGPECSDNGLPYESDPWSYPEWNEDPDGWEMGFRDEDHNEDHIEAMWETAFRDGHITREQFQNRRREDRVSDRGDVPDAEPALRSAVERLRAKVADPDLPFEERALDERVLGSLLHMLGKKQPESGDPSTIS